MADYCATTDIKTDMPDSPLASSTDYDDMLAGLITQASRLIDKEVGRWANYFSPSTDGETRYYDGSGETEQWIDECASLTSVAVSESGEVAASTGYTTWTLATDYFVFPYNASADGVPITRLDVDWKGPKHKFYGYRKGIKVTGVFGYSLTVPDPVKRACQIQVMRWLMRSKQGWQDASLNPEMGEMLYAQSIDPDVARLLLPYKIASLV